MLMPRKVKFRKQQRGRMTGKAWRGSSISFGEYGLKAMECGWVTARQIEAARIAMTRFIKRGGKVWVRVFPDKPITKKPAETRMGKGKGAPEEWVCVVRPGKILFEMEGVATDIAEAAMRLAAIRWPSERVSWSAKRRRTRKDRESIMAKKAKSKNPRDLDDRRTCGAAQGNAGEDLSVAVPTRNGTGRRREARAGNA